jgi:hypothetical protein
MEGCARFKVRCRSGSEMPRREHAASGEAAALPLTAQAQQSERVARGRVDRMIKRRVIINLTGIGIAQC